MGSLREVDPLHVQLTWNGQEQDQVSFSLENGGTENGIYTLAVQVAEPVTASGVYDWSVTVDVFGPGTDEEPTWTGVATGQAQVAVRDDSPWGAGWWLSGLDALVPVAGGVLYVYGTGESRLFQEQNGIYVSPAEDFGTLRGLGQAGYVYRSKEGTQWQFDAAGRLRAVVDRHGLTVQA